MKYNNPKILIGETLKCEMLFAFCNNEIQYLLILEYIDITPSNEYMFKTLDLNNKQKFSIKIPKNFFDDLMEKVEIIIPIDNYWSDEIKIQKM